MNSWIIYNLDNIFSHNMLYQNSCPKHQHYEIVNNFIKCLNEILESVYQALSHFCGPRLILKSKLLLVFSMSSQTISISDSF